MMDQGLQDIVIIIPVGIRKSTLIGGGSLPGTAGRALFIMAVPGPLMVRLVRYKGLLRCEGHGFLRSIAESVSGTANVENTTKPTCTVGSPAYFRPRKPYTYAHTRASDHMTWRIAPAPRARFGSCNGIHPVFRRLQQRYALLQC